MNPRSSCRLPLLLVLTIACASPTATAQFFTGSFTQDNDTAFVPFTSPGGPTFIRSLGYGGGVNSLGSFTPGGGFDPIVSVFDSAGSLLAVNDDYFGADSYIPLSLTAGSYTAVVTQYYNFPLGPTLGDGFSEDSSPNFAGGFNGQQPTWAIDITNSPPPPLTIAAARALGPGPVVTIELASVTNTVDLINSAGLASFQIQDATGGLTVFGSNSEIASDIAGVAEGDRISIRGTLVNFDGLSELQNSVRTNYWGAFGTPAPINITAADIQDNSSTAEGLESELVRMPNARFLNIAPGQTFAGLTNYLVTDGVSTAMVRVSNTEQNLVGQPVPTGPVSLRGIVSQFDTSPLLDRGYELLLTRLSDIQSVPEPANRIAALTGFVACAFTAIKRKRKARQISLR
jgi:hypothetical protein